MKWINRLYIIFLGIILSITTGFGIAAFYPQPVNPYSNIFPERSAVPRSCLETPGNSNSDECQKAFDLQEEKAQEQEIEFRKYSNENAGYTRTAIFLGIVIGSLFAIIGIYFLKRSRLIANGLLFGAVLTAILTRPLINIASLGSNITGTNSADSLAYVEFTILLILTIAIVFVGLTKLPENNSK
jgi:hypothetical protein